MKKILIILVLLLCGCSSNREFKDLEVEESYIDDNVVSSDEVVSDLSDVVGQEVVKDERVIVKDVTIEEDVTTEEDVVSYFESSKDEIVSKLDSDTWDNVKSSVKDVFKKLYGFCFKGEEIKGYTLSDLTTSAKEKVLRVVKELDEIIESKYPNYKDDFKESYENMKESAKSSFSIVKDTVKNIFSK